MQNIAHGCELWHVIHNGQPFSGRLLHQDETTVCLLIQSRDDTFSVRWFNAADLEPFDDGNVVHKGTKSIMPSFRGAITDSELSLLVDFLHTLR